MKKLILTAGLCVAAVGAFAQGQVAFNNNVSGQIKAIVYDFNPSSPSTPHYGQSAADLPTGSTVYGGAPIPFASGANYTAELWAAPGAGLAEGSLSAVAGSQVAFKTSGPVQGAFNSVSVTIPGTSASGGDIATLQVRAWCNYGGTVTTWAAALAQGYYGKSQTFNSSALTVAPSTATFMTNMQSFSLVQVPEPSTIALGVMGAAALLIRRRK